MKSSSRRQTVLSIDTDNSRFPSAVFQPPTMPRPNGDFPSPNRRPRRSAEQVIESLPDKYSEASYALSRFATLDLKASRIASSVSEETVPLLLEQRPDLGRFFLKK